jgi:uncharacterized membrane protein YfcA
MFPIGIVISTFAIMSGIGGAILFSPFFLLILGLDPLVAMATGLGIEIFGFGSGVIGYWKNKSIHFLVAKELLVVTVPAAIIGVLISQFIPRQILTILFALVLLALSYMFWQQNKECVTKDHRCTGVHHDHKEQEIAHHMRLSSWLGGMLVGMVSVGLGEINEYNFLKRLKLPVPAAAGTSIFIVAITAVVGVISHIAILTIEGKLSVFQEAASIIVFAAPAVIIGAQIGVRLSNTVDFELMEKMIAILFAVIGILLLGHTL